MRITSKGQVTVPKHIRDRLGIAPGDDIGFREEGQAVIVEKVEEPKKVNITIPVSNTIASTNTVAAIAVTTASGVPGNAPAFNDTRSVSI